MPDRRVCSLDNPQRYSARSLSVYTNSNGPYFVLDGKRESVHGNQLWTTVDGTKMKGSERVTSVPQPTADQYQYKWPEYSDDDDMQAAIAAYLHDAEQGAAGFEAEPADEPSVPSSEPSAAASSEPKRCVICMDDDVAVDHMMAPCHHLCLCAGCATRVRNQRLACPVCRRAQRNIVRVFL